MNASTSPSLQLTDSAGLDPELYSPVHLAPCCPNGQVQLAFLS